MSTIKIAGGAKRATLEMTIIRADGTQEPLGVVAYHHANPIRKFVVNFLIGIKRRIKG